MAKMPTQKPANSKQDYQTPGDFLDAVCLKLGIMRFGFDLAADRGNSKASFFYGEDLDSLQQDWRALYAMGWLWLNPPFKHIKPWAAKCAANGGDVNIAFLVPASVGSNWFRDHVDGQARVYFLNGRLDFGVGDPYPKDCILCLYGPDVVPGYEVWNWREILTVNTEIQKNVN